MTSANKDIKQSDLDSLDIVRVPADHYLWGGHLYSNASDVMAAAKRKADR